MNNSIEHIFGQFMQQMRGQDPKRLIDSLVASGRVSQAQLDQAQRQISGLEKQLGGMKGKFGF